MKEFLSEIEMEFPGTRHIKDISRTLNRYLYIRIQEGQYESTSVVWKAGFSARKNRDFSLYQDVNIGCESHHCKLTSRS
jgi:hypothetical protein